MSLLEAGDALGPGLREELLALKHPPSPVIQPIAAYGAFSGTTEPMRLRAYHAQSAMPTHKSLWSLFLFEPGLDPSLPAEQRAEWEARGIEWIHVLNSQKPVPSA